MIRFQIPDMTCKHCERAVTEAVQKVDPGATLTVDLASHQVTIDSQQPASAFAQALGEAGYSPVEGAA